MKNKIVEASGQKTPEKDGLIGDIMAGTTETNRYFGNVSYFYRVLEFLFLAAFLLFLIYSAVGNAGEVTYSKVEYIFRNFAMKLDENSESASEIIYSPDSSNSYSLFGNGIAVCGNSGLTVFSATGRKTCSTDFDMENPVMKCSSKYILVFDSGNCSYSVFNMFTRVFEDETDYPVRGACIADSGWYAIITGSDMYTSCIEVYDGDFTLRARYSKNGYITCADFSDDGKKIAFATLSTDSYGNYVTELTLNTVGSDYSDGIYTVDGDIPLGVNYTDGRICFVCAEAFYTFDENLFNTAVRDYGGRSLTDFAMSDTSVCLVLENNISSINRTRSAEIYTYAGSPAGSYETESTVDSVSMSGSYAYLLAGGKPVLLTSSGTSELELSESILPKAVLAYAEGKVYICCASAAYVTSFEK